VTPGDPFALGLAAVGTVAVLLVLRLSLRWLAFGAIARLRRLPAGVAHWRVWRRLAPYRDRHPWFAARLDPSAPAGLAVTLAVLAALYAALLFGGLLDEVMEAEGVLGLDQAVNAGLDPVRVPAVLAAATWVTHLGIGPAVTGVALVASVLLAVFGARFAVLPVWVTFLGAEGTTWAGKYLVNRPRPEFVTSAIEYNPSFPSGHATAMLALWGFLAIVAARAVPHAKTRFEILYWAGIVILAVGASRLVLGVHYLSDVAAGYLVGAFWCAAGYCLLVWSEPPPGGAGDGANGGR
jgi:undecaprenyl-diphosphatase